MEGSEGSFVEGEEQLPTSCNSPRCVDLYSRFPLIFSGSTTRNLHGVSCSVDEYFEVPTDYGIFDYIDGKLLLRTMADANHTAIQSMLSAIFTERRTDPANRNLTGLSVQVDGTVATSAVRFRRPDIVIGKPTSEGRVGFSVGNPPRLVIEVTSLSTRETDMKKKVAEYATAKIPEYWIIDREKGRILCYKLTNQSTEYGDPRTFSSSHILRSTFFGDLSVHELIFTPSAETVLANANSARRRAEESRRRGRNRENKLHEILQMHGIEYNVSSPSASPPLSPSRSPPRTRRRKRK